MRREEQVQRLIPIKFSYDFQHFDGQAAHYKVKLKTANGSATFPYFQGSGIKTEPSLESVLSCLIMDHHYAGMDLDDFMSELGYTERKEARRILRTIDGLDKKLERLGILDHIDDLVDIFQDY